MPEVAFERLGAEWFVEKAEIHIQTLWNRFPEVNYDDNDPDDPLLKAFVEMGFKWKFDGGWIELTPDGGVISVDNTVETFLANKPGARRSSLAEFSE